MNAFWMCDGIHKLSRRLDALHHDNWCMNKSTQFLIQWKNNRKVGITIHICRHDWTRHWIALHRPTACIFIYIKCDGLKCMGILRKKERDRARETVCVHICLGYRGLTLGGVSRQLEQLVPSDCFPKLWHHSAGIPSRVAVTNNRTEGRSLCLGMQSSARANMNRTANIESLAQ